MLLSVFEKSIFLQSLGWGIANSLWQAAVLWMIYRCFLSLQPKSAAVVRYHLSLLFTLVSLIWFIVTVVQNLMALQNGSEPALAGWMHISNQLTVLLPWISVTYLLILLIQVFRFADKLNGVLSLRKSEWTKVPAAVKIFTEQTALHLGISKRVQIWLSTHTDVPSVIGFLKPVILLPVSTLTQLTIQQTEAIILHELAHIKRNDYIINLMQHCIELLMFFNPFVKLLSQEVRKERENCCDDWVMNYRYNGHEYATALMILEQNRISGLSFALAATNGKHNLLNRIKRLFSTEPKVVLSSFKKIQVATLGLILFISVLLNTPPLYNNSVKTKTPAAFEQAITHFSKTAQTALDVYAYNEIRQPQLVTGKTVKSQQRISSKKQAAAEIKIQPAEKFSEYTTAYINDELLANQKELQELTLQVASKGLEIAKTVLVKIEEEQSGREEKNTYLLELKNSNGETAIKPMVLLNKKMQKLNEKVKADAKATQKIADSIKMIAGKIRITS